MSRITARGGGDVDPVRNFTRSVTRAAFA